MTESDEFFPKMYRFITDVPCEYQEWVENNRGNLIPSGKRDTATFNMLVLEHLGIDIMNCYCGHKEVSSKNSTTGGDYNTSQVALYNTQHSFIWARHGPL